MQLGGSARRLGVVVSRDGDATGRWRVVSKEFETKSSYSRSTVRHRIILVRMAWFPYKGASCCDGFVGYLGACDHSDKPPPDFVDDRQRILAVYKALREELPPKTAEITVVDPWNMPYLLRAIWRDARNRGHSGWDVLRAIDGATAVLAGLPKSVPGYAVARMCPGPLPANTTPTTGGTLLLFGLLGFSLELASNLSPITLLYFNAPLILFCHDLPRPCPKSSSVTRESSSTLTPL
jgi:hypothetical protein